MRRGGATAYDGIFDIKWGSNNLSKDKLRKTHDRTGFATCNYKCSVCKKFVRKSEYHIHEAVSDKGTVVGIGKGNKTIPATDGDGGSKTRFKPIKITKKVESFNEAVNLVRDDEINSSEAIANNPCLSCSFECFCIEEKRYLTCERIENWSISSSLQ